MLSVLDPCGQIEDILRHDPGGRGLMTGLPRERLSALADELLSARRVLVVTGFPITGCGIGETDGPPGAVNLAALLHGLGKTVCLVTDPLSEALVAAGRDLLCPGVEVACVPLENGAGFCRDLLDRFAPTHVIAIERPGKGRDGHFHNSRGEVIDAMIADTDPLLLDERTVTIAIGDGGNELGMGGLRPYIEAGVPFGPSICADLRADFTLASGVSNWWGWGLAALLSLRLGRDLLPSDEQETRLLNAVVQAGGVDGVTRRRECTVDSLSLEQNLDILRALRALVTLPKEDAACPNSL